MVVDTSIFIEFWRLKSKQNTKLYQAVGTGPLYVSSVTIFELYTGANNSQKKKNLDTLLSNITELPFSNEIAIVAADKWAELRKINQQIEIRDLFIGATALAHDLPVLTLNTKHFSRISGLKVQ